MELNLFSFSLPFIAALIGWFTNFIAIKMLFHPRKEMKFLFIRFQGIFPKRQKELAKKLGEIVSNELFSAKDVQNTLKDITASPTIKEVIEKNLESAIYQKLPEAIPMIAMFLSPQLVEKVKNALMSNVDVILKDLIDEIGNKLESVLDINDIVEQKVNAFSSDKLEEILFQIMKKEFKFVEVIGAVLGFIIGIIQVILMYVTSL